MERNETIPRGRNTTKNTSVKSNIKWKSYTVEGADVIAECVRDAALTVKSANLSDIIASRPEEEGLAVLKIMSDAFFHSQLEEVDL